MDLFLLIKDGDDLGVVIAVLLRRLAVVEVDQHVSQVLVQSVLDIVSVLLGLAPLVTLRMLLVVLLRLLRLTGSLVSGASATVELLIIVGLPLVMCGLNWLSLVLRLLILACIGRLCLSRPLVFVLNLVTEIIVLTIFWSIDALFLSVLLFTLFFSFLVVDVYLFDILLYHARPHLSSSVPCWLLGCDSLLLLLALLSLHLLFGCGLAFLLVDQVMHRHYRLFTVGLSRLLILALMILGIHCSRVHLIPISSLLLGLHGGWLLLRWSESGVIGLSLILSLLLMDHFNCLRDIKVRLDHCRVFIFCGKVVIRRLMVVYRHWLLLNLFVGRI